MTTFNLNNMRLGLAAATTSILRSHAYLPDRISPPCLLVSVDSDEQASFDATTEITLAALVLVSRADDRTGQARMDEYCSTSHGNSIQNAINAAPRLTYNSASTCQSAVCLGHKAPNRYEISGVEYIGVEFTVDVLA